MWELIKAGGWMMLPITIASVLALAISLERLWTLRAARVAPPDLLAQVWKWIRSNQMDNAKLKQVRESSPLGQILAAGIINSKHGREIMKESIEEAGSHVVHEMEKHLSLLATIAEISTLLGLLGTVVGIIDVFAAMPTSAISDPTAMAGGISMALINTAGGIVVAIPAIIMHRYFQRHISSLAVEMEQQAIKLVDIVHGDREVEVKDAPKKDGGKDGNGKKEKVA